MNENILKVSEHLCKVFGFVEDTERTTPQARVITKPTRFDGSIFIIHVMDMCISVDIHKTKPWQQQTLIFCQKIESKEEAERILLNNCMFLVYSQISIEAES